MTEKSKEYGHAIWLISDEPYREIVYRDTPLPWVPNYYPNTLVCNSFSKCLSLAGERLGYVLVPETVENWRDVYAAVCGGGRALGYINVSSLFQFALPACLGQTADLSIYA